jgi:hypothetical protein
MKIERSEEENKVVFGVLKLGIPWIKEDMDSFTISTLVVPCKVNKNKSPPRHIEVKLQKVNDSPSKA